MKKRAILLALVCVCAGALTSVALATPSTTYWTPCTLDFQPAGLTHITYDTYSRFGDPAKDNVPEFPVDYGLTWGANLGKSGLALEYGFDYLAPMKNPLFFNAKIGYPENTLSKNAPAIELGIFNAGTKKNVTDQNIIDLLVGKSLPNAMGRLTVGYYTGNATSLGGTDKSGYMVGYDKAINDKVTFAADYASGKNALGGGGLGLYYYFNKNTDLLVGPVWFNDESINGKMKWTAQLDINF